MSNKTPQPTTVLVKRLQRLARVLDAHADERRTGRLPAARSAESYRAFANTCWQSAARLETVFGKTQRSVE